MIAHVAEAGEDRGRVVLRLAVGAHPEARSIQAAAAVAQAFRSEIESVFLDDTAAHAAAQLACAREITLSGRKRAFLSSRLTRRITLAAFAAFGDVEVIAKASQIPARRRLVQDEPIRGLAAACANCGPWNVIVIGEGARAHHETEVRNVFDSVPDTTGIVVVGHGARPNQGPVLAIIEDVDRLQPTLRTATRLAEVSHAAAHIVLVAGSPEQALWMEGQTRLLLEGNGRTSVETLPLARAELAVFDLCRRLKCGFVIAQFDQSMLPGKCGFAEWLALDCALFLVR